MAMLSSNKHDKARIEAELSEMAHTLTAQGNDKGTQFVSVLQVLLLRMQYVQDIFQARCAFTNTMTFCTNFTQQ